MLSVLLHAGYNVLVPFGIARYDLVIEIDGDFKRVQCKTGRLKCGGLRFNVASNPPGGESRTYSGDADYFGVYLPDRGQVFLIPVEDLDGIQREATLRLEPTRHNQMKGTRDARPYLLDPMARSSGERVAAS